MKTKSYYQVTFYSPGTFFSESNSAKFESLDFLEICKKAKEIKQRYGASPYGFIWEKIEELVNVPKVEGFEIKATPKVLDKSKGTVFITGTVIYSKDLNDREDSILRSNLESNNDGVGVINTNSYKFHSGFGEDDSIIDWDGKLILAGNDPDLVKYRKDLRKERKEKYGY